MPTAAEILANVGFAEGERDAENRMHKRETDRLQREQEEQLLMRGNSFDYRVDKSTAIRGTAAATLGGGHPKLKGFKIELKKEF